MKRGGFKHKPLDPQAQLKEAHRQQKKSLRAIKQAEAIGDTLRGVNRTNVSFTRRRNKYGAIATWVDGIKWPSKLQAGHYQELKLLQAAGIIKDLDWEVDFALVVNEVRLGFYRADFTLFHIGRNKTVIVESKGRETPLFKWKWKHFKAQYGSEFDFELIKKQSVYEIINSEF